MCSLGNPTSLINYPWCPGSLCFNCQASIERLLYSTCSFCPPCKPMKPQNITHSTLLYIIWYKDFCTNKNIKTTNCPFCSSESNIVHFLHNARNIGTMKSYFYYWNYNIVMALFPEKLRPAEFQHIN